MHQFISIMFSLLVITGLQVSVQAGERRLERSFYFEAELIVTNGGGWGSWGRREMCPYGTYAAGFSLRMDMYIYKRDQIGHGDDTGLNGICLHCLKKNSKGSPHVYQNYSSVRSDVGRWGRWTDIKWCPSGFLTAFQLKVEAPQGAGDDTAADNIRFKCSGGSFLQGNSTHSGDWGDWGDWSKTCKGKGICGIKTRVEQPQGKLKDDTALNDVHMFCCD